MEPLLLLLFTPWQAEVDAGGLPKAWRNVAAVSGKTAQAASKRLRYPATAQDLAQQGTAPDPGTKQQGTTSAWGDRAARVSGKVQAKVAGRAGS